MMGTIHFHNGVDGSPVVDHQNLDNRALAACHNQYVKGDSTGIKEDHGVATVTDPNVTKSVSFGFTFSAAPNVVLTVEYSGTVVTASLDSVSTTGFVARLSSSTGTRLLHWHALGY